MKITVIKALTYLVGIVSGILLFLYSESWMIALIIYFGFIKSTIILSILFTILSLIIVKTYSYKNNFLINLFKNSSKKVVEFNNKFEYVFKGSYIIIPLLSGIIFGPLPTTLFIKTINYKDKICYFYALVNSLLFSILWSGIYSGVFGSIKKLF